MAAFVRIHVNSERRFERYFTMILPTYKVTYFRDPNYLE